jgi:hypothetical protein
LLVSRDEREKVPSCQKSLRGASIKLLPAKESESKVNQSAEQLDVQKTTCESGSIVARKTNPFSNDRLKKLSCTIPCEDRNSNATKCEKKREWKVISSPCLLPSWYPRAETSRLRIAQSNATEQRDARQTRPVMTLSPVVPWLVPSLDSCSLSYNPSSLCDWRSTCLRKTRSQL